MVGRYKSAEEKEAIEAEAARLFLKARASDNPADWDAAYAWVASDPSHGPAFAKAEAGWELTDRLREVDGAGLDQALDAPDSQVALSRIVPPRRGIFIGIAAAAAIVCIISTMFIQLNQAVDHYRTAIGETRVIRLADGSVVHLNTNSSLEVSLGRTRRSIKLLRGEARFDVAHDKSRPFVVDAHGSEVRAVGTAFNIRLRADLTELTVIEGRVTVKGDGAPTRQIGGGSSAAMRGGSIAVTTLAPVKIKQRIAWQAGLLEFDGDTLAQAVEEFNRYRSTPLVVGDPQIASLRVGGAFRADRSLDFVKALESGMGVRAVAGQDQSIILVSAE